MRRIVFLSAFLALLLFASLVDAQDKRGNRLAYLDEPCNPYYVGLDFPKLVTPQWIGEPGVEAVVVLAIDDMRDTAKYEAFLRPILDRLKKIDSRAPLSIMSCRVDPKDPQLAKWLDEGLSIEVHTYDHPCPLLKDGDFQRARGTYEKCVDLMADIPGNRPVAFRMPCCDSLNTPSPRFYTEIFNQRTERGNFLAIDTSVFNVFTSADAALQRDRVTDAGGERFRKYIPFPSFVNTIENYPYPYVIDHTCWQFPCVVPSDWEAQNLQSPFNPRTVEDLKAALDCTVAKQGVMNLVFHPHGWIRSQQVVELIDHAVAKHGGKVKFLNFREALERLDKNLLAGVPLRDKKGADNGVRLLDLNDDGFLDVVSGNESADGTRIWSAAESKWNVSRFPLRVTEPAQKGGRRARVAFGVVPAKDAQIVAMETAPSARAWRLAGSDWIEQPSLARGLDAAISEGLDPFVDAGARFRDLDGDGCAELVVSNGFFNRVYRWNAADRRWNELSYGLPGESRFVTREGGDAGTRLLDIDRDGDLDVIASNENGFGLYLFDSLAKGWKKVASGKRGDPGAIPMIARSGKNNGAWFHSGHLWVQNEDTSRLLDLVDRMSFPEMLALADTPAQVQERETPKASEAELVPVGAARIDITPNHPIRLSGYGNRATEASGFETRIWAKALAIGGDANEKHADDNVAPGPAVIITVENCGVATPIVDKVAEQLAKDPGIPRERIAVCSSHSHTAPQINGFAPFIFARPLSPEEQKHIDDYTAQLTGKLVAVARKALAARRPARLSWGVGSAAVAANRRVLKDGLWTGFGVQADGPVDHSLPILAAHDEQGRLVAVLANYACHCTTLGGDFNRISGDWAGYAQDYLEAEHPGAVALISIGCGADANPNPRGELEMARKHGRTIADEVNRLLKSGLMPVAPSVACRRDVVDLPLERLPSKEEWQKQIKQGRAQEVHRAESYLARIEKGEKIPGTVPYTVSTWTFGDDLAMVFLAGEVVVDYAIRLKSALDDKRLWITAYANDVPCYIPSKRVLREGGYEADFSMIYYGKPTRFAPGLEDVIADTVQRLLPQRFYSKDTQAAFPSPKSPEESLAAIEVRKGMRVELVAAEPLVVDPVAFDWGPDGRLWVVEMRDYPDGLDGHGQPGGRVKVLRDTDGDGRYDAAQVFLDGVPFPTGVKVWRSGVLVSAAPEIFYAEDTDGDGRADVKKTLYRGFGEGNQQHRVNGLRWGLDNWLHVGNGDSGGDIKSEVTGEVVSVSRRDLRIRPDEGKLETTSGNTQFGRSRDDWGNWFGGNNSNPVWHYVLDERYLRRNKNFAPPDARHQISISPGAAPVFPASRTLTRFNDFDKANRFTSACSPIVYRDHLLGEAFYGNTFVCEPVHNLVEREVVSPQGVTFSSRRADDEQAGEFLASRDNWFRPSMVRTGPDGALWIADMYRSVIEHPKWIPEDWQRKLDVRAGDTRGRIYRVYAEGRPPRKMPRLDRLSTAELVSEGIGSENGWVRDMAQQMLIWKADRATVEPLEAMVIDGERAASRLQALCTLDGLSVLSDDVLLAALGGKHPAVRRHAIRLSESRLNKSEKLGEAVLRLLDDDDPQVQLQLAYSLGEWNDRRAAEGLARLALAHHDDVYFTAAVMSSLNKQNAGEVLAAVLAGPRDAGTAASAPPAALVEQLLAQAVALDAAGSVKTAVTAIAQPHDGRFAAWQLSALAGMLDALAKSGKPLPKELASKTDGMIEQARASVASSKADEADRVVAMRLLGRGDDASRQRDAQQLAALLGPQSSPQIQSAAVDALARLRLADAPARLLAGWRSHTPSLRSQILDVLLSRRDSTEKLLDAIAAGDLPASQIDAARSQRLLGYRDGAIRRRAEKLLAAAGSSDRQKVVADYQAALALEANAARGKQVFAKRCSQCHKLEGVGHEVGPDLTALSDKSPQSLLVAMLDPNKAVEDKFLDYIAVTNDGRLLRGMLAAESGSAITLRGQEGKDAVVLRSDIDELLSSGKSLMPEGIEKDVTPQDVADVIAYVRGFGPPPSRFPGNKPELVTAAADGSLLLAATSCRIYGPRLVFEQKYQNLGWWSRPEDRAVWSLAVSKAGKYRVTLDYACADAAAGNKLTLRVAGRTLSGTVPGTGTWDDYREWQLGALELPAGAAELEIRSDGRINEALLDLRAVRLVPQ